MLGIGQETASHSERQRNLFGSATVPTPPGPGEETGERVGWLYPTIPRPDPHPVAPAAARNDD